ncbi:MAG TPA: threonine/serine exporter family protein, partial [Ruania sp.]|nr:threonine/serine exporter family protein [Ruania sp.]
SKRPTAPGRRRPGRAVRPRRARSTPDTAHVGTGEQEAAEQVDTGGVPTPPPVPPLRAPARWGARPDAPGRFLREKARLMVRGQGPPTVPLGMSRRATGLTAAEEHSALDLVLRVGEAMITTGAPVADVTADMLRLAEGLGVANLTVDITFTSVTATIDRDDEPVTKVRVIRARTSDYTRLIEIYRLVGEAADGSLDIAEAHTRLEKILSSPHPYSRLVVTAALGLMAAGVAVLLGGGWAVALVAGFTTIVIDRVLRFLRHHELPYLFQQTVGGAVATLVAVVLLWGRQLFDWNWSLLPPSLVVASGIMVLLAGLSVVGAAEDAIAGYPLTSAARAFEVVMSTIGIIIGIGVTLSVAQRLGVPLSVGDLEASRAGGPALVTMAAGATIAGAWAIASYTRMRVVALIAAIGALASGAYVLVSKLGLGPASGPFGNATSAFIAALLVGLIGGALAARTRIPSMVIAVCGVTPFLPGLSIYRAMYNIVDSGHLLEGLDLLVRAVSVGLALAAGVTLGEFLARSVASESDKWQRWMRKRARGTRI